MNLKDLKSCIDKAIKNTVDGKGEVDVEVWWTDEDDNDIKL